ncbi:MAG: SDR family NAD(P)-dependent oxidoreductase [Hyphomicrobiaceae bacterium]
MLLADKTAIITGAAGGLGLACARRLCENGARVVLADIDQARGEAAAAGLRAEGFTATYRPCDVTKRADIQALVDDAVTLHGRLDCAIANAGIVKVSDPLDISDADFDAVLAVNLKGVFLTGQIAARQMMKQAPDAHGSRGTIINMSSVNAILAIPEIAPYAISKGGVNQWTRTLGIRLAKEAIRVNAIGPGSIATELFKTVASSPDKYRAVLTRTPMGRAGRPEEVGDVAVFLASHLSSYMIGQTVYPDGGRMFLNYTVEAPDPLPDV